MTDTTVTTGIGERISKLLGDWRANTAVRCTDSRRRVVRRQQLTDVTNRRRRVRPPSYECRLMSPVSIAHSLSARLKLVISCSSLMNR